VSNDQYAKKHKAPAPIRDILLDPNEATLEKLMKLFPRESVSKWTVSGYRTWYRRQSRISRDSAPGNVPMAKLRAAIRAMTEPELVSVRESAETLMKKSLAAKK